jgi:hypothetical protein
MGIEESLDWITRTALFYALWTFNRITGYCLRAKTQGNLYLTHLRRAHLKRYAYFYEGSTVPLLAYEGEQNQYFSSGYIPRFMYCFDTKQFSSRISAEGLRPQRLPWITASFIKGEEGTDERQEVDITEYITGVRWLGEPPTTAVFAMAYLLEQGLMDDVSELKLEYCHRNGDIGVVNSDESIVPRAEEASRAEPEEKKEESNDDASTEAVIGASAAEGPKIE